MGKIVPSYILDSGQQGVRMMLVNCRIVQIVRHLSEQEALFIEIVSSLFGQRRCLRLLGRK